MKQQNKISPAAGEFLFEIDPQPLEESITALGGVPLLVRVMRSLGVPGSVQRNITLKERDRGYDEATYVESLVVLHAVGYVGSLREPRFFDLWITKLRTCPRVKNFGFWGGNSYRP